MHKAKKDILKTRKKLVRNFIIKWIINLNKLTSSK